MMIKNILFPVVIALSLFGLSAIIVTTLMALQEWWDERRERKAATVLSGTAFRSFIIPTLSQLASASMESQPDPCDNLTYNQLKMLARAYLAKQHSDIAEIENLLISASDKKVYFVEGQIGNGHSLHHSGLAQFIGTPVGLDHTSIKPMHLILAELPEEVTFPILFGSGEGDSSDE